MKDESIIRNLLERYSQKGVDHPTRQRLAAKMNGLLSGTPFHVGACGELCLGRRQFEPKSRDFIAGVMNIIKTKSEAPEAVEAVGGEPPKSEPDASPEKKLFGLMLAVVAALLHKPDDTPRAAQRLEAQLLDAGLFAGCQVVAPSLVLVAAFRDGGEVEAFKIQAGTTVREVAHFSKRLAALIEVDAPEEAAETGKFPQILKALRRIQDENIRLSEEACAELERATPPSITHDLRLEDEFVHVASEDERGVRISFRIHEWMLPRHLKQHARRLAVFCGNKPPTIETNPRTRILVELEEIKHRITFGYGSKVLDDSVEALGRRLDALGWSFSWEVKRDAFGARFGFEASHKNGAAVAGQICETTRREVLVDYANALASAGEPPAKPEPEPERFSVHRIIGATFVSEVKPDGAPKADETPGNLDEKIERMDAEREILYRAIAILKKHPVEMRNQIDYLQATIDDHCEEMSKVLVERAVLRASRLAFDHLKSELGPEGLGEHGAAALRHILQTFVDLQEKPGDD